MHVGKMKMKRKKQTVMNKALNLVIWLAAIVALLAILLQFDFVAEPVSGAISKPVSVVQNFAKTALWLAVGALLLIAGVKSLAVPLLGIILIVVGFLLILMAVWPTIFSRVKSE